MDEGIFLLAIAECLASERAVQVLKIDNVSRFRLHYVDLLTELVRRVLMEGTLEGQIFGAWEGLEKQSLDQLDDDCEPGLAVERSEVAGGWQGGVEAPPTYAWRSANEALSGDETNPISAERRKELLRMIEAFGNEAVIEEWRKASPTTAIQGNVRDATESHTDHSRAICRLLEGSSRATFKDKATFRLAQYYFTRKILVDVTEIKKRGYPSRQTQLNSRPEQGQALTRALTDFIRKAHGRCDDKDYQRYRRWWMEGKIWLEMASRLDGAWVLFLVPSGTVDSQGERITEKR